jgi:hypothetical protein
LLLQVGRDPRPVMRAAENAFKQGLGTEVILAASAGDASGRQGAAFYAHLYSALYHEADGQQQECQQSLLKAVQTPYAQQSKDYMVSVARVHALQRGWQI